MAVQVERAISGKLKWKFKELIVLVGLRRHGLRRFCAFVLITMLGTLLVGSLCAGIVSYAMTGEPARIISVAFILIGGGSLLVPIAFILWFVPSALVFSVCVTILEGRLGTRKAIQWAGAITALLVSAATTCGIADYSQETRFVGLVMIVFGLVATGIAPWAARKAFSIQ